MKKMNENTKVTLTLGQLKRLVKEAKKEDSFDRYLKMRDEVGEFIAKNSHRDMTLDKMETSLMRKFHISRSDAGDFIAFNVQDEEIQMKYELDPNDKISATDFSWDGLEGSYTGIIFGLKFDGSYLKGRINFRLARNGDFEWEIEYPKNTRDSLSGGGHSRKFVMISQGVEFGDAKKFYDKIVKVLMKTPQILWDDMLTKVRKMVDKFKEVCKAGGLDTSERPWWYGTSDHMRD